VEVYADEEKQADLEQAQPGELEGQTSTGWQTGL
jgi:hypothetical protein